MTVSPPKIAVVEDEEALQLVLLEWLTSEGFKAFGITTGKEALEVIPKKLPDLILLDIILPEVDGFEVMKKLGENPQTANIPIIVLTNLPDEEEHKMAMFLGAKEYLVKVDYDFPALKKIINRVLGKPPHQKVWCRDESK